MKFVRSHPEDFVVFEKVHSHNTRGQANVRLTPHSKYASIYGVGGKLFNLLPAEIKGESNRSVFVRMVHRFFTNNVFYSIDEYVKDR